MLSGALMTLGSIVMTGGVAHAAPAQTCETNQWGINGVEETSGVAQYGHFGLRGDVYVGASLYCNRVSSINILSDFDTTTDRVFVEFGWVLGWSNCNNTYYSTPRLFVWWSNIGDGNAKHCTTLTSAGTTNAFHTMRIADVQGDRTWNAYYGGSLVANSSINTNWPSGAAVVNSERSNASDSAFAEFLNMEEYFSAWSAFDDIRLNADNDPGFHWVRIANDHAQVVAD